MESIKLQSFKYWKTQEVEETFGIQLWKKAPPLSAWLESRFDLSSDEERVLMYLQDRLRDKVQFWNEAALRFYFIGPLISLVNYDTDHYNSFLEQRMTAQVNGEKVEGNVDFLVATGRQIPKAPFFTLHEYKAEPNVSLDPLGQLLIGMVAAQQRNDDLQIGDLPLFGAYVLGRLWFFVYLKGGQYAQSLAFDATQEDIFQIYYILKKVKDYIEEQLMIENQ